MKQFTIGTFMLSLLALSACGGGGSASYSPPLLTTSNSVAAGDLEDAETKPGIDPPEPLVRATRSGSIGSSFDVVKSATEEITKPEFSTTNTDSKVITITVQRPGQDPIVLSNADDHAYLVEHDGSTSPVSYYDYAYAGYIVDYKRTESTVARTQIYWSRTDPSNYVAGGYWMHFNGDIKGEGFTAVDAGAFVDGEKFLRGPQDLPTNGTAKYSGSANGFFAVEYGQTFERDRISVGDVAVGEWEGSLELGIYFDVEGQRPNSERPRINGCIGVCDTPGNSFTLNGESKDFSIVLWPLEIDSDGTFDSTRAVYREAPVQIVDGENPAGETWGHWDGMLSPEKDSSGHPLLVAGTVRGGVEYLDDTEAVFIGAFYGSK